MSAPWPIVMLGIPVGLVLGSFAVTAAMRYETGGNAWSGGSRCDSCAAPLGLALTVPVVSFVRLGGRCSMCRAPISRWHPFGEVAGATVVTSALLVEPTWRGGVIALLGLLLLAAASVDLMTLRLPNAMTLAVGVVCAALAAAKGVGALAIGIAASGLTMALLAAVRSFSRTREGGAGLGVGDIKLMGALALWLGPTTPWSLTLAAVAGLFSARWAARSDGRIPFGPFIASASLIVGWCVEIGATHG